MWKALVGFLVFAAIALFFIFKAGDKVDMQGEAGAHAGAASEHVSAPAASAEASIAAPTPAAEPTARATAPAATDAMPAAASASASK